MVLIPLLDVLQSVPILGYLSFTVAFFFSLFPGRMLGPELAAIFAVFTSQAWNMAFSFYQSLCTLPTDLDEAARGFRFSGWQRFWRLEAPFAVPGLVWNMMMSMSGGWFFVVAAEAISVGTVQVALPGVGSMSRWRSSTAIWAPWVGRSPQTLQLVCGQRHLQYRPGAGRGDHRRQRQRDAGDVIGALLHRRHRQHPVLVAENASMIRAVDRPIAKLVAPLPAMISSAALTTLSEITSRVGSSNTSVPAE